jgi:hypothetical protein
MCAGLAQSTAMQTVRTNAVKLMYPQIQQKAMPSQNPELKSVSGTLLQNGSISLAGNLLEPHPADTQDKPFICSSWVRSYQPISRKASLAGHKVRDEVYLRHYPDLVDRLWPSTTVWKSNESQGAILAYVCGSPGVLHYVYVVPELRGMGVAMAMIEHACGKLLQYTNLPPGSFQPPANWTFNPYFHYSVT